MKNYHILFIVFFFSFNNLYSQDEYRPNPKYPDLFKDIPVLNSSDPQWVKLLYSEEPNVLAIETAFNSYFKKNIFKKTIHTQNYKHFMGNVYLNNYVDSDNRVYKPSLIEENKRRQDLLRNISNTSTRRGASWTFIGPMDTFNSSGVGTRSSQVNVYTFDQSLSNPDVLLSGTESGAAFISLDKGDNWQVIADELALGNRSVGAVAIDPTNSSVMYIAAGNSLFKSIDTGANWNQIHNISNLIITDISVNPTNAMEILTAGNLGLYKSIDGGNTWSLILNNGRCWDIERKVNDANTVFVAQTNPATNIVEIYKTTNISLTSPVFVPKTVGYFSPTNSTAQSAGGARIAVTNADVNRLYVVLLGNDIDYTTDNNFLGIYKSTDAGETWSLPYDGDGDGNPDNDPGGPYSDTDWCMSCFGFGDTLTGGGDYDQGFYNLGIAVSDTNPDEFLVGMLSMFLSTDGAVTFKKWGGYICDSCGDGYRHPDIQEIEINGSDVWVATDGGLDLYTATDFNQTSSKNNGMNGTEYWGFGQGWQEDVVVGGRYHNGNAAYRPIYTGGKFLALGGGEAPTGYVNAAESQKGSFSDIDDKDIPLNFTDGVLNSPINASLYPNQEIYNLRNRSEVVSDPRWSNVSYLGRDNNLWKTTDSGVNYSLVKEFTEGAFSVKVTDIEIPRSNPDYIYVVLTITDANNSSNLDSKIYKSTDSGVSWSLVNLPSGHSYMELQVATDNENEIYISFGNDGTAPNKIFSSTDGGVNWNNLTTATLNRSVRHLIIQDGTDGGVYAITYNDIYYRNNSMADWEVYGQGLPTVRSFNKLIPFYRDGKLRAATYNRGMLETPLFEVSHPIAQPIVTTDKVTCSRQDIQFEDYSVMNYAGASWLWSFPGASSVSSTTVRNPVVSYDTPGLYDVTLTVTDGNGITDSKTITSMVEFVEDFCTASGYVGEAMAFGTNGDRLRNQDIGADAITDFTVTSWIRPNDLIQSPFSSIFSAETSQGALALNYAQAGNNNLAFHIDGSQWWIDTGLNVPNNQWSYVAMVVTATNVTIYLNEHSAVFNYNSNAKDINAASIGSYLEWNGRTFKGLIEELTLWKKALTSDEIRKYRHITKENIVDADLLAYYQFNNYENATVLDAIGTNDFVGRGTVNIQVSTAPVASGVSQKLNISNGGIADFNTPGVTIDFNTASHPSGDVYVSKLNALPDETPSTNQIETNYWVINNYGANSTFTAINSIEFNDLSNVGLIPSTAQVDLFKRNSNDDLVTWPDTSDANTTIFDGGTNTITFNLPGITSFSQIFVGSSLALGIDDFTEKEIKTFPNPVTKNGILYFKNINEDFKFTLFDISGKEIYKTEVSNNEMEIKGLTEGIYLYRIETKTKILHKKLIITD